MNATMVKGSIGPLMDELVAAAGSINEVQQLSEADSLAVFRWKPPRAPGHAPALWHWMTEPPAPEQKDTNRIRDHFAISAFIGTRHTDQDKDMARLESLMDAYRATIDPLLWKPGPGGEGPLNGTARWAKRLGIRLVAVEFAGIEWIAFEVPLELDVDRPLIETA